MCHFVSACKLGASLEPEGERAKEIHRLYPQYQTLASQSKEGLSGPLKNSLWVLHQDL